MFSKISQIGKNLSEEISRINDEVNSDQPPTRSASMLIKGAGQQWNSKFGKPEDEPAANSRAILATVTPNAEDLTQPTDEEASDSLTSDPPTLSPTPVKAQGQLESAVLKSPDTPTPVTSASGSTPQPRESTPTEKNLLYIPNTTIRYSELQPELRSRMRKFVKYEEKYPILLESYRTEKKKSMLIDHFEKAMKDLTPVSSIGEVDGFRSFIDGLISRSELLNKELVKVSTESKREVKSLQEKVKALEEAAAAVGPVEDTAKVEELTEKLELAQKELESAKTLQSSTQTDLTSLKTQISDYESRLETAKQTTNDLNLKIEQITDLHSVEVENLQKSQKSKDKLIQLFKDKLSKAEQSSESGETREADLADSIELKHECDRLTADNASQLLKLTEIQDSYRKSKVDLQSKSEEVDNLKDMLRDIGDDLVTTRNELKTLKEMPVQDSQVDVLKSELETLRIQHSASVTNYEKSLRTAKEAKMKLEFKLADLEKQLRLKEKDLSDTRGDLATRTKNLETITKDFKKLKSDSDKRFKDVEILRQEKTLLEKRVAELSDFKSKDVNLKLDLSSAKSSLSLKEKQLAEAESKARYLEKEKESLNDKLIEIRVNISELTSTNKSLMETKNEAVTKNENLRQTYNELLLKFNKLGTENNILVKNIEELKDRYSNVVDAKYDSGEQLDSLKKRCEELSMRAREAEIRVNILEEELADSRTMLQERTRETGTIRKLLTDSENSTNNKIRDLNLKLETILEEKERIQSEAAQSLRRKQREVDDLRLKTNDIQETVHSLQDENENLSKKLNKLVVEKSRNSANQSEEENGGLSHIIENLRDALRVSEQRSIEYENLNTILKKVNDETSLKLERMNKNYKILSQQLRTLKERKASITNSQDSKENSPVMSRQNSLTALTAKNANGESETVKERTEYIRNVLLGFLEHREQRQQLLPVVKTLLELDGEDEDRFLTALSK
ncbi:unnamed protein product [Kuraishia capsulata CBS 1993]|uniref:GRIP domain-containing protein n=1 Tax=Kuraishia capsulata CBS 1993 TaxID=1382522 RepID=W6MSG0_9ASCO|nr:uncharacterized protein KUCA_T00005734001 [Kuraishia capsulata CBS 1993]CDK29741.1 unnamed protein product [Kuraishia capsulata CBS 1993]